MVPQCTPEGLGAARRAIPTAGAARGGKTPGPKAKAATSPTDDLRAAKVVRRGVRLFPARGPGIVGLPPGAQRALAVIRSPGNGPGCLSSLMKRILTLALFAALILVAHRVIAGGQQVVGPFVIGATPGDQYTFETSRRGFQPIDYPGRLNYFEMARLLFRRQGEFHERLSHYFREWPSRQPADLWALALPQALKVRLRPGDIEIAAQPAQLRLGIDETYNLPLILLNERTSAMDLKIIATLGEQGPTDRFHLPPGLTYGLLNLHPTRPGKADVVIRFYAGSDVPPEDSPPESRITARTSLPAEVAGWGKLRLRTVAEGLPVAARVSLWASDGLAYAPSGESGDATLSRITFGAGDYYFYSRGEHLVRLPEGRATIEALRGIEYRPARQQVEIRAGQTADVTLQLERFSNLAAEHWYGGDVHIHANYNNHEFITPRDIQLQILGEDLNVGNLMVANSDGAHIHDEQYFEGRPHRLSGPNHILYWTEEMRNFFVYGHICLTGIKTLVKPLYTGFENTPHPDDYPPNHFQALAATRQGGAASYAHPGGKLTSDPRTMNAREMPIDLALGSVQALDVFSNGKEDATSEYWYRLLNTGLRCAISAGTDTFTNYRHAWIPGGSRVYVHTNAPLNYQAWVDNYKLGRSFATNGPVLRLTVNGQLPGAELDLKAGDRLTIAASAASFVPMEQLEIVMNGEVIASAKAAGDRLSLRVEKALAVEGPGWIAARVRGPAHRYVVNDAFLYAHTSPVYVLENGKKIARKQDGEFFVRWIDQLIDLVEERGRFSKEQQKQEVFSLFRKAREYYEKVAQTGS